MWSEQVEHIFVKNSEQISNKESELKSKCLEISSLINLTHELSAKNSQVIDNRELEYKSNHGIW